MFNGEKHHAANEGGAPPRILGLPEEPLLLGIHRANELGALWKALVSLIPSVLPSDHLVAALPYEGVTPLGFKTTMADGDSDGFRLQLYGANPPLIDIARQFPGMLLADLDEHVDEEELGGSRFYQQVMAPHGMRHAAALLFWNGDALGAHVGVWRSAERGRFDDNEKGLLTALHPHLDAAIRRVALIARLEMVSSLMAEALEHPSDYGIALLDAQGRLVFQNQAALVSCALWSRGRAASAKWMKPTAKDELPACVQAAATGLLERYLEAYNSRPLKGAKFEIEIPHPDGEPVSARAKVVAPKSKPVPLHVRIEFSRLPHNGQETASGLPVYRLSKCERRVALLVAQGMRNQEVAEETGLSVHTVRAHLREIFSKLGLRHRGQLGDILNTGRQEDPDYNI